MTALPVHPVRDEWVPLDDAAKLLGKSEGHLRRLCATLRTRGLARRTGSGWQVHAAYDARLAKRRTETTEDGQSRVTKLLSTTTAEKRDDATTRAKILIAFRAWRTIASNIKREFPAFQTAMIEKHGDCPKLRQLYNMHERCPESDDFLGCVAALVDQRGRPTADLESVSDEAWSRFCELYLTPNRWSIAKCHRIVEGEASQHGWAWPSKRRVEQLVCERLDESTKVLRREGATAWARRHQAPIEQDPDAWAAGQCWEGDHTTLNFFIRVRREGKWVTDRPHLTAWVDRRSRRVMGWHLSCQGNSGTIRAALIAGLKADGVSVPEFVWIDNGKDFMAASITGQTKSERRQRSGDRQGDNDRASGLLNMLGIEAHFATPYNHNGKARVERFFGTVHTDFDREFTSWCGDMVGMIESRDRAAVVKDVESLPTLDEARERLGVWIDEYNGRADHAVEDLVDRSSGELLSRDRFYELNLPSLRKADPGSLDLLGLVWSRPIKPSKRGVGVSIGDRKTYYGAHEPRIEELVGSGKSVYVTYDPDDVRTVGVWDEDFRLICRANMADLHGGPRTQAIRASDLRQALAERRAQARRARDRVEIRSVSLTDAERAAEAARRREIDETRIELARQRRDEKPEDLPPLRMVGTPVDGQADEHERAKIAVGAEAFEAEDEIDFTDLHIARDDGDDEHELSLDDFGRDEGEPDDDDDIDLADTTWSADDRQDGGPAHDDEHEEEEFDVLDQLAGSADG